MMEQTLVEQVPQAASGTFFVFPPQPSADLCVQSGV